jgi:hypothetical protein
MGAGPAMWGRERGSRVDFNVSEGLKCKSANGRTDVWTGRIAGLFVEICMGGFVCPLKSE